MPVNTPVLDNALTHFLSHQSPEAIAGLMSSGASLWGALSMGERFQARLMRREVSAVLEEINAFIVLGSIQRIRPDIAKVVGTDPGLAWLDRQLVDLRGRFAG